MPILVSRLCFFHWVSHFQFFPSKPTKIFSSLSSPAKSLNPNSPFFNYLTNAFKLTETQALSISVSSRFSRVKALEKPQSVHSFLQEYGLSETQIRSAVRASPQILFADINKTLRPKLEFFRQLGITGSDLSKFISKNSTLLTVSLDRKLVPCVEILKEVLGNGWNGKDLARIMSNWNGVVRKDPQIGLLGNIAFLESCGIVGSQLSKLLKRKPSIFVMPEPMLRDIVSQVLGMGFSVDSRMLVHALYTVSCLSNHTFRKKIDLFRSFGFSEDECMEMFRRAPSLLRTSEEKLMFGIDFFLNTVKFKKSVLVHKPTCLMNSMENRVIPRYKVLQVIKSKKLLNREPSLTSVLDMTEDEFLEKFISRYRDDEKELLFAYKGRLSDSCEKNLKTSSSWDP